MSRLSDFDCSHFLFLHIVDSFAGDERLQSFNSSSMADWSVSEPKRFFFFFLFRGREGREIYSDRLTRNLDRQMYQTVQRKGFFRSDLENLSRLFILLSVLVTFFDSSFDQFALQHSTQILDFLVNGYSQFHVYKFFPKFLIKFLKKRRKKKAGKLKI